MKNLYFLFSQKKFVYIFSILLFVSFFHRSVFAYHDDDLRKIKYGCINFPHGGARLNDADLSGYIFNFALFPYSSFNGAKFQGSSLVKAFLGHSDFESANFEDTNLTDAIFIRSILLNVNLKNAKVEGTNFANALGLTNDQKKYLRDNGAINVPNDLTDKEFKQELTIMEILRAHWVPELKVK